MSSTNPTPLYLGMAMWSHKNWQQSIFAGETDKLAAYGRVFNTVEGNTTFYATPSSQSVLNWRDAVADDFRFTFKLPQTITHQMQLQNCSKELNEFLHIMSPLAEKTGVWKIQLPAAFGPDSLYLLEQLLDAMPTGFHSGVEVRHPAFFAKGEAERALNRLLIDKGADRIIIDTRPVFSAPPDSEAVIDAHQKKPRVPVHAIATSDSPVVRFIGHPELEANDAFFTPWLAKLSNWIEEGRRPFLFVHTPDNAMAPELAVRLLSQLQQHQPQLPSVTLASAQPVPQMSLL
ncbi:DUF72 domain-containing protein [Shewanella corallii]|uniref:DUF72 domain-containing protein n=1 Tax=Shewanella corallii TaxID=560080 RepID=A0ABT0N6C6_9GAMM|nr:DUF72 domain-containing protein [Shewanella corallii]MCL2913937.1 DUF72 domain-containing protein [Shewanella corallii]